LRFEFKLRSTFFYRANLKHKRGSDKRFLSSSSLHWSTFPAFSHDSWCTSCIARRVASPAASTMRFGLCALRSGISRYTYATRDLLPMIMRGWKYALQEGEEGEEMGPRPRLSNGRYRLTWPRRRPRCIPPIDAKHGALPARWREEKLAPSPFLRPSTDFSLDHFNSEREARKYTFMFYGIF